MKKFMLLFAIILLSRGYAKADDSQSPDYYGKFKNIGTFIENKGQWPDHVKFLAKLNGMNCWITDLGIIYDYYRIEQNRGNDRYQTFLGKTRYEQEHLEKQHSIKNGQAVSMMFDQCRSNFKVTGKSKSPGYYNYFFGKDPAKWVTRVNSYNEVKLENVYSNIDAKVYFDGGKIRYDMIINPGADLSKLKFKFDGQDNLSVNPDGELLIATRLGIINHNKIFAYQEIKGEKVEVNVKFKLLDKNISTFIPGDYDKTKPLVIDPLVYSTFVGGNDYEQSRAFMLDENQNVVIGGNTYSSDFPKTPGAYQNLMGSSDAFIAKLNSSGTGLIFSSVFGGSSDDWIADIDLDSKGNIYGGGGTFSTDFPVTTDAFDPYYDNITDCIMIKLSNDGSSLEYATYMGGNGNDEIMQLVTSDKNEVFVMGMTSSPDPEFPITDNAYDKTYGGNYDIYIAKFNPNHSYLDYSTYIGGNDYDGGGTELAIDDDGNAYVTGLTMSIDYPVTANAYDKSYNGNGDMYMTILNSSGSGLVYSTFLGGSGFESGMDLLVMEDGKVIILAGTNSTDYPVTSNAYDKTYNGSLNSWSGDALITIFNEDYQSLYYSTYIGGSGDDWGYRMVLSEDEDIYFTGELNSTDYPITSDAWDNTLTGQNDIYMTKFDFSEKTITYSTYLGGDEGTEWYSYEWGMGIQLADDDVIIGGYTAAADFPITTGAFDDEMIFAEIFITRLSIGDKTPPEALCRDISVVLGGGTASITALDIDNGSNDESGIAGMTVSPNTFGCGDIGNNEATLTVTDNYSNTAECYANVEVIGSIPEVEITVDPSPAIDPGGLENTIYTGYGPQSVQLSATDGYTYDWSSIPAGFTSTEREPIVSPTETTEYIVGATNDYGCTKTESVTIQVLDYQTGLDNHMMWICHDGRTIRVARSAVPAHLDHGDMLGPCPMQRIEIPSIQVHYDYYLGQNYPNPFSDKTVIEYYLPEAGYLKLCIYDVFSKRVAVLEDGFKEKGSHRTVFEPKELSSGTYTYRLEINGTRLTGKMILVK